MYMHEGSAFSDAASRAYSKSFATKLWTVAKLAQPQLQPPSQSKSKPLRPFSGEPVVASVSVPARQAATNNSNNQLHPVHPPLFGRSFEPTSHQHLQPPFCAPSAQIAKFKLGQFRGTSLHQLRVSPAHLLLVPFYNNQALSRPWTA
jgi:hypothetical protein